MAKTVIDVSYCQPGMDWNKVKKQIDGAILRCGYGSNMTTQDDTQWLRNVSECERLGIPYGVYLYSYADSDAKIQSEIDHTLRLLKGHRPVIGVYLDLEENKNGWIAARAAKAWCQKIKAAGYKPGIYCGAYFYKAYLKGVYEAVDALWWIAGYGTNTGVPQLYFKPNPGFPYDGWQYTSVKRFDGINGGVDTSEWYTDWNGSTGPTIAYRAHCQNLGWLSPVSNGDIAGTTGESLRMEALKISPPEGVVLEVDAHIQNIGWKGYPGIKKGVNSGTGSSPNDPIIGTVGKGLRLEAVRIRCTENTTGKKLKYQAHVQGIGWQPAVTEGMIAGTTGRSLRMEAIKIWME